MQETSGNLWSYIKTHKVCVPVNIGWTHAGLAVMGRGVARQAAARYLDLPKWWGAICQRWRATTAVTVHPTHPLIMVPVKPLDEAHPELSWQQNADLWLIEGSLLELAKDVPGDYPIVVPLLGCGNGKLDERPVRRLMHMYLNDRFTLVRLAGIVREERK